MSFRLALALTLAFTFAPTSVFAQSDEQLANDEQAHTHFDSGHLYFERGEYDDALREFQAAYDLSHRAPLLYNLYLTLERLGRAGDAADRLEAYLASDVEIDATERTNLEARMANLRERAAQAATTVTPPAPTPPPPASNGGLHELGIAGVIALGVGGAALITFAITGGLALSEDSRLAGTCGRNVGSFCTESDVSTLRTLDTVADVMLGVGLAAAAAGAVLLIVDLTSGHEARSTAALHVVPLVSPTAYGVAIGGVL